jgi:hypothetical protein
MNNLLEYSKYDPRNEYDSETRRELDLDRVRKSKEFRKLLDLGFKEETSHQQQLNNTLKFVRTKHKQKERGHDDVFYTIHPSGIVRRYNPLKSEEIPQGSGNDLRRFPKRFRTHKDYIKALNYLFNYIRRKEEKGDYR